MDPAAYYEAKCALLNLKLVLQDNEHRAQRAQAVANAALLKCAVPVAPGYAWDDATFTITPVEAGHGR
jgi:hypothetical protein